VPIRVDHLHSYGRQSPQSMATNQSEVDSVKLPEKNSSMKNKLSPFAKLRLRRNSTTTGPPKERPKNINVILTDKDRLKKEKLLSKIPIPIRFQDQLLNPNNDLLYKYETDNIRETKLFEMKSGHAATGTAMTSRNSHRIPAPSLFLQEGAHLISLLSAVALSTLRNDIDIADSPISPYIPGVPWPDVDPDNLPRETKEKYGDGNFFWRWVYFCLGLSRSAKRRTLYNAVRPFGVLGGVSDNEIYALHRARGPSGKVALVSMWLQEFIVREYLAGSVGKVTSPLPSRLNQFISDGVASFNQGTLTMVNVHLLSELMLFKHLTFFTYLLIPRSSESCILTVSIRFSP
jgi:hypothetical protein